MRLRTLRENDVYGMLDWMHDPEVNQFFRFDANSMTEEKALAFVEQAQKDMQDRINYNFAITEEDDEYLGTISLKDVDWEAGTAEFAISLRTKAQGKGLATKATKEILRFAFEDLGLNRIYLNVLSDNKKAIHLYEKCGFINEGEFVNHLLLRGKLRSLKWFAILKDNYMEET